MQQSFLYRALLLATLTLASTTQAAVIVQFNQGTVNTTTALTGFQTHGDDMDGMRVTAFFGNGGSQTLFWADTGFQSGGVSGAGWSLNMTGDTFSDNWTLAYNGNSYIDRILIDAGLGDSVFDTTFNNNAGTAGSASGRDFTLVSSSNPLDITATYFDAVALTGNNPVGDLFRYLDINFTNANGFRGNMVFKADTDNLKFGGDITPVPEPETLILLGLGLLAFSLARWQRQ